MAEKKKRFRVERDSLGTRLVPRSALYGIQTLRAFENFPISGIRPKSVFIKATALIKLSACIANLKLGLIDRKIARAIIAASVEIIEGEHHGEFIVDAYQAGAGTSHNMNANEVIANRAIEILGGRRGDYASIHPNDHVNMSQSTNDAMPAALKVAILLSSSDLIEGLSALEMTFKRKSREFSGVIKSGRTHLQDAVPITLGQEFASYAGAIKTSSRNIKDALKRVRVIGLGGTAVGTGINTHPKYRLIAVKALSEASGIRGLKRPANAFEAHNSMADFTAFSGALKETAVELVRISNDLRLLSSGPRTGLAEIKLPAVQPGSSIMPGKVNPVIAEMLCMVCFQVIGNDLATALAAQAGQLELNVMIPVINYNILSSIELLSNAARVFDERCVNDITADRRRCRGYFDASVGIATVLNRYIGYEKAAEVAKESEATGKTVRETILERGIMDRQELDRLLSPKSVTAPNARGSGRRRR